MRQPAWSVDAVQKIVVDFEGEVEALAVVLDPALEVEVFGVSGGRKSVGPVEDAGDGCCIGPFAFGELAVDPGSLAGEGVEGFLGLREKRGSEEEQDWKGAGQRFFLPGAGLAGGAAIPRALSSSLARTACAEDGAFLIRLRSSVTAAVRCPDLARARAFSSCASRALG